ncbi:MAG: NACHT domain-containing protein, partial [Microcystaceae cyanobacterium]
MNQAPAPDLADRSSTVTPEASIPVIENWQVACQSVLEKFLPCDSVNTLPGGVLQTLPPTPIALKVLARNVIRDPTQNSGTVRENALLSPQNLLDSLPARSKRGHRLALIGDAGTGKTLFLQYLAKHLLDQTNEKIGWPIWVSPLQLKNISLQDYLFQHWLKEVQEDDELPLEIWKTSFEAEIALGRVWILADGMDYLYSEADQENTAGPLSLLLASLSPWGDLLNIAIACHPETQRLDPKALKGFRLYQTQELTYPETVEATIKEWFTSGSGPINTAKGNKNAKELGEGLCQMLAQPEQISCRQWLTRPIRLTLCCRFWQSRPTEFPTQSADLYRVLTEQFYQWKAEQANCNLEQQKELARCLGELGKIILLEDRSRTQPLTQTDVDKVFGKQSPLLRLSVQLGWLIPQGVVVASYWQRGYIFFDPTFQDYFTALSIEDWRFFLDTNSHCYRLFEAPWQRVMMLWWGRRDVKNTEKEAFLAALFNFNDHCGVGNFYGKRAQILTAIALQEFKESEQSEQILTTL